MTAAGSLRTQPHCLISKMAVAITMKKIIYRLKVVFLSACNPLRSQIISLKITHTSFTVVDGQQVVYLFLSWRICNLSSSHADLPGAPLRQRHRARSTRSARSANRLVGIRVNGGADEGICCVWATLVHYRLRVGEREASTWRCEERLGHRAV